MMRRGIAAASSALLAVACSGGDAPADAAVDAAIQDVAADVQPAPTDSGADVAPEAAPDTGPPPLVCQGETAEPNDSEVLATPRPQIDDCDGSGTSISGVSSGTGDPDWIRFRGKDTTLCAVDPTVKINVAGLRLCAFVMCTDGATTVQGCNGGVMGLSPAMTKGCCTSGTGSMTVPMNCTGTSDDADVFIRVDQPDANMCVPYKVDYHF